MVKNLKRMRRQLEREDRAGEAQQYDFFPVTFILPNDYNMFVEVYTHRQAHTLAYTRTHTINLYII